MPTFYPAAKRGGNLWTELLDLFIPVLNARFALGEFIARDFHRDEHTFFKQLGLVAVLFIVESNPRYLNLDGKIVLGRVKACRLWTDYDRHLKPPHAPESYTIPASASASSYPA